MTIEMRQRITIVLWLILITVAIQVPLLTAFFTDDDFDHIRATLDNSDLYGRPNWYNYILTSWLLWKPVLTNLEPFSAYFCLRLLNILLFAGTSYLLYRALTVMNAPRSVAVATPFLFLLHPLAFEVHLRLSCMHYIIGMFFMFLALLYALQYSISRKTEYLLGAIISETLCLFSSIHGLVIVPALLLTSLVRSDAGSLRWSARNYDKTTALYLAPFLMWISVFLSLPLDLAGKTYSSPGMIIFTHQLVILSSLLWAPEPSLLLQSALWSHKTTILGYSVALAGVFTSFAMVVLFLLLLIRWRNVWFLFFGVTMLLSCLFLPPKPYHMSRYAFFLAPWASLLLAYLLHRLFLTRARTICVIAAVGAMATSADWYTHQVASQRLAGRTNLNLSKLILSQKDDLSWQLQGFPQQYGVGRMWPRATFYQLWHMRELFAFLGVRPQSLSVSWCDGREMDDQSTEYWADGPDVVLVQSVWDGPDYELIIHIMQNHGLESTSAPPAAGTLETHP